MNFQQAISSGFGNYVNFSGRAARSEFWYWLLFALIVSVATAILDTAIFPDSYVSPFNAISGLILFLPGLAMWVRRLHDLDRTGWWMLIVFTVIGIILLIVWACMKGTTGTSRYGPDPLA